MIDKILEYFDFPTNCNAIKKLKTYILDNLELKASDKKIIKTFASSITLHAIVNQNKINIPRYEDDTKKYVEIYLMSVEVSDKTKMKQISQILQIIPKPLILIFIFKNEVSIQMATRRMHKNDSTKLLSEDFIFSDWFDMENPNELQQRFLESLKITNQSFLNLLVFYESYLAKIISFNASKYSGKVEVNQNANEILAQITSAEQKINELKNKIKKETSISDKVNMNIELKKLNDKLKSLKEDLK